MPEVYRRTTPGELPLIVRTNRGGDSAPKYIRFAEQKMQLVKGTTIRPDVPAMRIPVTTKTRP